MLRQLRIKINALNAKFPRVGRSKMSALQFSVPFPISPETPTRIRVSSRSGGHYPRCMFGCVYADACRGFIRLQRPLQGSHSQLSGT